jgi:hypothetical protein
MYKVENGIPTWEQTLDQLLKLRYRGPEESESNDLSNNSPFEIRNPKFLS